MYTVYGIPNCDTVKKALTWLEAHQIPYSFHNYKKQGITAAKLKNWSSQTGWEALVNRKGTTLRKLDPEVQASITSEKAAIQLLAAHTSAIKRPLIENADGNVTALGFDPVVYEKAFKK
ncbi:MAG: arsenate reductase [Bacteroidetes bacterium]|nr:arsenate reductase [Bacteroidota bacterium]